MTTGSISALGIKQEMAAAEPLDVTQIIEEAKIKAQSAPRIRYIPRSNPKTVRPLIPPAQPQPALQPTYDPETPPPHPKKRLLASLKKENKGKVTFKEPLIQ